MSDAPAAPVTEIGAPPVTEEYPEVPGVQVFVGNLAYSTTDEGLKTFVTPVQSDVLSAQVVLRGSRSAGYGLVALATAEAAQKPVETLNNKELDGRQVVVEVAKPSVFSHIAGPGIYTAGSPETDMPLLIDANMNLLLPAPTMDEEDKLGEKRKLEDERGDAVTDILEAHGTHLRSLSVKALQPTPTSLAVACPHLERFEIQCFPDASMLALIPRSITTLVIRNMPPSPADVDSLVQALETFPCLKTLMWQSCPRIEACPCASSLAQTFPGQPYGSGKRLNINPMARARVERARSPEISWFNAM
ncbi:hypothetical protein DFH06DRAFT_1293800 [Mycena polygramma]|nr:hypothetical protein DFH06DRAFT_1293800 [Mycena polygramma]